MADETAPTPEPSKLIEIPAPGSKKKTVDEVVPDVEVPDGDLCDACWPEGWPKSGDAAECSHGTWTR